MGATMIVSHVTHSVAPVQQTRERPLASSLRPKAHVQVIQVADPVAPAETPVTTPTVPPAITTPTVPPAITTPTVPPTPVYAPPGSWNGELTFNYALDAQTTDTPDWGCIRTWESGGNYTDYSGAYGFVGADYGDMPPQEQDAYALQLFQKNGDRFEGVWNDKCTMGMGLR
jgi:hypothetical protein